MCHAAMQTLGVGCRIKEAVIVTGIIQYPLIARIAQGVSPEKQ